MHWSKPLCAQRHTLLVESWRVDGHSSLAAAFLWLRPPRQDASGSLQLELGQKLVRLLEYLTVCICMWACPELLTESARDLKGGPTS